ncbi:MAG: transposase [Gemmatimonadetes bacterium]|nr:transposase [Gemmatimonadota bacterium]
MRREILLNLREARVVIEDWRHHYNEERPHSRLGYLSPAAFMKTETLTRQLGQFSGPGQLRTEIKGAKQRMEKALECGVPVFCWVGGEEDAYTSEVATLISRAGFAHSFMTNSQVIRPAADPLQLQRTNIEADYPLWLTRFQLSGFMDLLYMSKRRRVNRLTRIGRAGA